MIDVEGVTDISLDFSGNSLLLTLNTVLTNPTWTAAAFNGLRISFLNTSITAFDLLANDFDPITTSFSGGDLFINWSGASYNDGDTASFNVSPVPVPAALPLLAMALAGIAGLGLMQRRKPSAA